MRQEELIEKLKKYTDDGLTLRFYGDKLLDKLRELESKGIELHHKTKALKIILACNNGDQNCNECPIMTCSDNTSEFADVLYRVLGKERLLGGK